MFKTNLSSLLCTLLVGGTAWAAPGFHPATRVFDGVKLPLESVVRVVIFSDDDLQVVPADHAEVARRHWAIIFEGDALRLRRLECDHPGPDRNLVFARNVRTASGVVLGDRRTILTASHAFDPIDARVRMTRADGTAKVMVLDARGRVLLDGRFDHGVRARGFESVAIDAGHPLAVLPSLERWLGLDGLTLHSTRALSVPPVRAIASAPVPEEPVYLVGYPFATADRERLHQTPDSDGQSLRISRGVITDVPAFYAERLRNLLPDQTHRDLYLGTRTFMDADAVEGSSGGPLFDRMGRLVGIMNARLNADDPVSYVPDGHHALNAETIVALGDPRKCEIRLAAAVR